MTNIKGLHTIWIQADQYVQTHSRVTEHEDKDNSEFLKGQFPATFIINVALTLKTLQLHPATLPGNSHNRFRQKDVSQPSSSAQQSRAPSCCTRACSH